MEIDFSKINIEQVRDDVNLILWNNNFNTKNMEFTNKILEELKNVKIYINN